MAANAIIKKGAVIYPRRYPGSSGMTNIALLSGFNMIEWQSVATGTNSYDLTMIDDSDGYPSHHRMAGITFIRGGDV